MLRILNHSSTSGQISVVGFDDEGIAHGPATIDISRNNNISVYSEDLESGGTTYVRQPLGSGRGNWRLELTSNINFEAISYSVTQEGLLSSLTSTVQGENGCWRVPFFYSTDNDIKSLLRITNLRKTIARITIGGRNDSGTTTANSTEFDLDGDASITITADELTNGTSKFEAILDPNYEGSWQLAVASNTRIEVMNLLVNSRSELSNISRRPNYAVGHCWLNNESRIQAADQSITNVIKQYVDDLPPKQPEDVSRPVPAVPAMYGAIVSTQGLEAIAARGVKKAGESAPATTNDKVLISSNTKPMTATMVAVLVGEGVFDNGWDTTWGSIFPEHVEQVHEDFVKVTLRDIIIHEGGITENLELLWVENPDQTMQERRVEAMLGHMKELAVSDRGATVKPGTFEYSHVGYLVVGAIVEKVTGRTYEELMQEKIFLPLSMTSAGWDNPGAKDSLDQPWGHFYSSENNGWTPTQTDYSAIMRPSGGVHVTIEDWAKFIRLWIPGSDPMLLDRETLNEMLEFAWLGRKPFVFFGSSAVNGAGWFYYPRIFAFGSALNHPGANLRWHSLVWVMRDINKAYITITNSHIPPDEEFGSNPTYDYVLNFAFQELAQTSVKSEAPDLPSLNIR